MTTQPPQKKKKTITIVPVTMADPTPNNLLALAVTQHASPETIAKFMDLQDRYEAKLAKRAFDEAMAAFQSECPVIKKTKPGNKTNAGATAFYYATLEQILGQVKALIRAHGFSYAVKTKTIDKAITAICIVKHAAGHSEESELTVPSTDGTQLMSEPQKVAAALTFAKRYAFCNAFGIMTGDTEDLPLRAAAPASDAKLAHSQMLERSRRQIAQESRVTELNRMRARILDEKTTILSNQEKMELAGLIDAKLGKS